MANMALLVMDVQEGTVQRLGEGKEEFLQKIKTAVDIAHKNQIRVIFVVFGFRPNFPEISPNNKIFSTIRERVSGPLTEPRPLIDPVNDDVVVVKRRVSAFSGSDLEVLLRAGEIKHLILSGLSTSGVVLSTTREAADRDYEITILSDLCSDLDPEVHRVLIEKVFPRQATVLTSEDWANTL
jgi:nicotinamidase-related amidase